MNTDIYQLPITDLMPHDKPMAMLDHIVQYDDDCLTCSCTFDTNSMFGDAQQRIPACLGIELMAQTAAVYGGIQQRLQGIPLSIGYLVSARHYQMSQQFFLPGIEYTIQARCDQRNQHLHSFQCRILESAVIAEALIHISVASSDT